jgi:hypothetical protein
VGTGAAGHAGVVHRDRHAGVDSATLDLLGVLRRSGPPYTLSTRDIAERTLVVLLDQVRSQAHSGKQ